MQKLTIILCRVLMCIYAGLSSYRCGPLVCNIHNYCAIVFCAVVILINTLIFLTRYSVLDEEGVEFWVRAI